MKPYPIQIWNQTVNIPPGEWEIVLPIILEEQTISIILDHPQTKILIKKKVNCQHTQTKFDLQIAMNAPNCGAEVDFKALVGKEGNYHLNCQVIINQSAHHCLAFVQLFSLLTSPKAHSYQTPAVLVHNHTSQAVHSSICKHVLKSDLWYFLGRGISFKKAKTLLIKQFLLR